MVVLYSTDCPQCKVLKHKLDAKHIDYTVNSSVEEMMSLGIMQVPVLSVDGELLVFGKANEWVNRYPTKEGSQ